MSSTNPPDELEFFKNLMRDETILNLIKEVAKMQKDYGDDGDKFMSFFLGSITNLFNKPENAIACLEAVKFGFIMKGLSLSSGIVSDELRQKQSSEMRPV